MKFNYWFSHAIGWIIGAAIIFSLGLYLYHRSTTNDGYKYVDRYINNSEEIKVDLNASFTADMESYVQKYSKDQSTVSAGRNSYPFYSTIYKKYFAIQEYAAGATYTFQMESTKFQDTILATVNKAEMVAPSYGTKENPIPILKMRLDLTGKDSALRVLNISENRYRYNVGEYLTHFKSKEDFKKMFEE